MRRSALALAILGGLAACQTIPESAETLTGPDLTAELTGQRLVIRAPQDAVGQQDLVLIAALRADGTAGMAAQVDGVMVDAFADEERWEVQGQDLCIFDSPEPVARDCIQVDWIGDGRIQLTETRPDGTRQSSVGTLTPL